MSGHLERLEACLDAHRPDKARKSGDVIATFPNPDGRGWRHLTGEDLRAAVDELKQLRAERDGAERERLREHAELNLWRANRTPEEVAWMADLAEGSVELIAERADSAPQQPEHGRAADGA